MTSKANLKVNMHVQNMLRCPETLNLSPLMYKFQSGQYPPHQIGFEKPADAQGESSLVCVCVVILWSDSAGVPPRAPERRNTSTGGDQCHTDGPSPTAYRAVCRSHNTLER